MIQMIQARIANRGKSFLASIVLALFVFGVVQMLTGTWLQGFFSDFAVISGLIHSVVDRPMELFRGHDDASTSVTSLRSMRVSVLSYRLKACF